LIFRSFEEAIPTVVLARKGGIDASKPPIRTRMGENLCKICSNQAIKVFAELFSKSDNPSRTNFSYRSYIAAFSLRKKAQRKS